MSAGVDRLPATVRRSMAGTLSDRRTARFAIATLVIGGYIAVGFAFRLGAESYLLAGIPITIAFQRLVVRRPIRALWLRRAPSMTFSRRSLLAIAVIAIAPGIAAMGGFRTGNIPLIGWGLAGMAGAVGAVYALRAMGRDAVRATVRATLGGGAVLVAVMVAYRLVTGGVHGNVGAAAATTVVSIATYLPVVFVMEEVLFRGLIDPYLRGSAEATDRASSRFGSALWGIWHLPVAALGLGILTIPYLITVHLVIGSFLVTSWRRTDNLAAPGIAHAVIDALRNAVAVL
jgi:membrane protease YdiL (CAAX protease family)